MSTILLKVFVREFYRLNAGFFMVVITLTFGFMSGVEHKALADFFVAAPLLTLIPISVWCIYALKVSGFNRQRMRLPENVFLHAISIIPYSTRFSLAIQVLLYQFSPIVLYGLFLLLTAFKQVSTVSILLIIGSIALLLIIAAHTLIMSLNTPVTENRTSALKRMIDRHVVRPLWWIYITTILRKEPLLFFGTKIFSGVLLFAVMKLYEHESFDGRLLAMATTVAGVANYMIMMQLQLVDFLHFSLMRNLPITTLGRWLRIILVVAIVLVPELVVIIKYSPSIAFFEVASIVVHFVALTSMTYSLVYLSFREESTYSRLIFALTILHVVLILFKIPVALLAAANFAIAAFIFYSKYYRFELSTAPKE